MIYQHSQSHPENIQYSEEQSQDNIGIVMSGKRDQRVDVAIVSVLPDIQPFPYVYLIGPMGQIRDLQEEELDPENPIRVLTCVQEPQETRRKEGIILEYPAHHIFEYPDRPKGLLMVGLIATSIFTQPGDSGALLVDELGQPMGMLIGIAEKRSFFMHIRNICQAMQLKEFSDNT